MKKIISAIMTAAVLLLSAMPMTAFAEEAGSRYENPLYEKIEYGGLYYYCLKEKPEQYIMGGVADTEAESFTIPQEIDGKEVTIGWGGETPPFTDCKNLKEINIEGDKLGWWYTIDGVLFRDQMLMYYPRAKEGDYTIPDGTLRVDSQAFWYAEKLGKLTVCPGLYIIGDFFECSLTEFDGRGMWGDEVGCIFKDCPNLKTIRLNGYTTNTILEGLPELENLIYTPESTIRGNVVISECPKLRSLKLAECIGASTLKVEKCDGLERLSFYNGFLGMSEVNWTETVMGNIPDYSEHVKIDCCMTLKEIDVLSTPYVTSHDWMSIQYCPALERVTFREMPQSAMLGEEPDPYYLPMQIGMSTGQFTVVGRDGHAALKTWCGEHGYAFEALDETDMLGDVNGDMIANSSDAALILIAAAALGAGQDSTLTDNEATAADVNGDGYINASDAALIMQYAASVGAGKFTGDLRAYLENN